MVRTRKQAAAASSSSSSSSAAKPKSFTTPEGITVTELPLSHPDYTSKPSGKTLLDIIEEKRPRDAQGNIIQEKKSADHDGDEEEMRLEEVFGPGMNTLVIAVPMVILLFWLDVIVHMQYLQEIEWRSIALRCLKGSPAVYLIHYWFHPRKNWKTVQAFLWTMSVVVGCYTVTAVNKNGYFAVMKRVPPLGTLWVWAVIEMDLLVAAASLLVVAAYTWWNGFAVL